MAMKHPSAESFVPQTRSVARLRAAARHCQGCLLYRRATQTVFGEGPAHARVMLVGETPGDQEDLAGRPFVGPAGKLLAEALAEAHVDRQQVYVTNAVKHFKWVPRGKRRLHAKPSAREIAACHPWLAAELAAVEPELVMCLGATAAQSLLGREFRLTRQRGQLIERALQPTIVATYHPSAVLRAPSESRGQMRRDFVHDLHVVARWLADHAARPAAARN